jgi:23S rRNA (cytidine1920-2'-O)/16S rRNA (cytidine1409-2'-O)-methyltransferase
MPAKRADLVLVERGFFPTRAKAQEAIAAGLVRADGAPVGKPSQGIAETAMIEAQAPYPWVSRGGVKLAAALDAFGLNPSGMSCLDIGASTGGFTHVLLERGAAHVVAVDVGHGQLHPTIATDPRVVSHEGVDARALDTATVPAPVDLCVIDVSFIPLALVLPAVAPFVTEGGGLVVLIKPQFEAGKDAVKKGIVRDEAVHTRVCTEVEVQLRSLGFTMIGLIPSPIDGGDGNREFLIGARKAHHD